MKKNILKIAALLACVTSLISCSTHIEDPNTNNPTDKPTPSTPITTPDDTSKKDDENKDPVLASINVTSNATYYNNGKAEPKKEDFTVVATYELNGQKDHDETLESSQFEMTVPADFASKGGEITFTFEGKTATLNVTLTEVAPTSIEYENYPAKRVYKVGESFSADGMNFLVTNNDGSQVVIDSSKVSFDSTAFSEIGQKEIEITYEGVTCKITISVVNDLSNEELGSIYAKGSASIEEGKDLSQADLSKLDLEGNYLNGNILPLNVSDVEVVETGAATLSTSSIHLKSKKGNAVVEVPLNVTRNIPVTSITLKGTGVDVKEADSYEQGENGFVNAGKVSYASLSSGSEIRFLVSSPSNIKGDLKLKVANTFFDDGATDVKTKDLALNRILDLKLLAGDRVVSIDKDAVIKGVVASGEATTKEQISQVYSTITLKEIPLWKGNNTVVLTLKDDAEKIYPSSFNLAGAEIESLPTSKYNVGEYISWARNDVRNLRAKPTISNDVMLNANRESLQPKQGYIPEGAATKDDTLYLVTEHFRHKKYILNKIDINTMRVTGQTDEISVPETTESITNDDFNCFYYEGKIGVISAYVSGKVDYYDAETLAPLTDFAGPDFNSILPTEGVGADGKAKKLNSVIYNDSLERFAIAYNSGEFDVFDKNLQKITAKTQSYRALSFGEGNTGVAQGIWGNNDFIYGLSSNNKGPTGNIRLFDWNGTVIEGNFSGASPAEYKFSWLSFTLTNAMDNFRFNQKTKALNIQNIFEHNGELYCTLNNWDAGVQMENYSGAYFYKLSFGDNEINTIDTSTFGGYMKRATKEAKTPAFNVATNPLWTSNYAGDKGKKFSAGSSLVYNGQLFQVFAAQGNGSYKLGRISSWKTIDKVIEEGEGKNIDLSKEIKAPDSSIAGLNEARTYNLFTYKNMIGVYEYLSRNVTWFDPITLEEIKGEELPFLNKSFSIESFTFNEKEGKWVCALENSNRGIMIIPEEDMDSDKYAEYLPSTFADTSFKKNRVVADDSYIYVSYGKNGYLGTKVEIWDWNGNFISTVDVEGLNDDEKTQVNAQSLIVDGESFYVGLLSFGSNLGLNFNKVEFDMSIFTA